eukprot:CAMPEP_0181133874 /NCGR_PEP_ID=MMETSP1071-20121207/31756_1 /TAXON_ID=35127 /ORGANISM="Thalassiosira sp., Strain NH16" /LENGTH=527 /DNA_ID=CAMNT_0023220293 /DNA_START=126 /DNA_END=1709 /DNA_ORIENTATION=+
MIDHIDSLLDQAIAYADQQLEDGGDDLVDGFKYKYKFPRDELTAYDEIANGQHNLIEMHEDAHGQRGIYAKCDIIAGTWVAISQPIVAYWDVETKEGKETAREMVQEKADDIGDNDDDGDDNRTTLRDTYIEGSLILRALEKIQSSPFTWEILQHLYPRDVKTASALPPWVCDDASTGQKVEKQMKGLHKLSLFPSDQNETICNEIALLLPLMVRYNAFIVETSSELFVIGLYGPELSYFNHSCSPNVSKFSIGDVTFLFANRDVAMGGELCHCYFSHEYICESTQTRNAILANDFALEEDEDEDEDEDKNRPAKRMRGDDNIQTSGLICVPPFILSKRFDPSNGRLYKPKGPDRDFLCNSEYLFPIWKARILEGTGRSNMHRGDKKLGLEHALPEWEAAIEFAEANFPPLDMRKIPLYIQASLCASVNAFHDWAKLALRTKGLRVGDQKKARHYADKALEMHHVIFGGWKMRFLKRYSEEFLTSDSFRGQMSQAQLLYNLDELWGFYHGLWDELTASKERGKELIK